LIMIPSKGVNIMNKPISSNDVLNAFETISLVLTIILDDEVSFSIADREKFLKVYDSSNLPLNNVAGQAIPEGGAAREAINTGKVIIKTVPKEIFGIPFKSYAIPVKGKDDNAESVILVGKSLAKKNSVLDMSQHLSDSAGQITDAINSLALDVNNLANMNMDIANNMKQTSKLTEETDMIIEFVKGISSQTNLLGLNAAIEAARVGESGKGFNIVAKEIRKLSTSTTESVKKIDDLLKNVRSSIESIADNVNKSNQIYQQQASALQEIAASLEELSSTAQMMEKLSEKI